MARNNQYHSLFPCAHMQKDKASVLTETVRHLKKLRRMVADMAGNEECRRLIITEGGTWPFFLPTKHHKAVVSCCTDRKTVKASVCCEDRPGFNRN